MTLTEKTQDSVAKVCHPPHTRGYNTGAQRRREREHQRRGVRAGGDGGRCRVAHATVGVACRVTLFPSAPQDSGPQHCRRKKHFWLDSQARTTRSQCCLAGNQARSDL